MKKCFAIFLFFTLITPPAFPLENTLDTSFEFGRKGSSGLVEEEDLTDEFYFSKYAVKFSQKIDKTSSYYLKYQFYQKDFDTLQNLDNSFNAATVGFDTILYSHNDISIKTGPDFTCKNKFYRDSDDMDYTQLKFELPLRIKKEKDWAVALITGINSYIYYVPKNDFKTHIKVEGEKKLFDEVVTLSAFYKFQYVSRQNRPDRNENSFGGSAQFRIDAPIIRSAEGGFEQGLDNTIIYEEREDSYDYKYFNWYVKTKHVFFEKLKGFVKYTNFKRAYQNFNHDNEGFGIENNWALRLFEVNDRALDTRVTYLHKQFRYPFTANPFAFHNNNIFSELEFSKQDDWKMSLGFDVRFYDYPARRTNDKIYYISKAGIEKYFLKKSFTLGFDYKYTFKNFLHKIDITEDLFQVRATYKF